MCESDLGDVYRSTPAVLKRKTGEMLLNVTTAQHALVFGRLIALV